MPFFAVMCRSSPVMCSFLPLCAALRCIVQHFAVIVPFNAVLCRAEKASRHVPEPSCARAGARGGAWGGPRAAHVARRRVRRVPPTLMLECGAGGAESPAVLRPEARRAVAAIALATSAPTGEEAHRGGSSPGRSPPAVASSATPVLTEEGVHVGACGACTQDCSHALEDFGREGVVHSAACAACTAGRPRSPW